METDTKPTIAKPIKKVVDIQVIAEPPNSVTWLARTPEEIERALIRWADEFERDFLRDHRSQDAVTLRVERVTEEVCSACDKPWEEFEGGCSYCGLPTKEG